MYIRSKIVSEFLNFFQNFLHEKILFYIFLRRKTFYQQFHRIQSEINFEKFSNMKIKVQVKKIYSIFSIHLCTQNQLFYSCNRLLVIPITRNNAIQLVTRYDRNVTYDVYVIRRKS